MRLNRRLPPILLEDASILTVRSTTRRLLSFMTAPNRTMVLGIILACYLMIIVDISVIRSRTLGFSTRSGWVA